ncbi:MAG: carbamoyltransferase [Gemmatimonadetes bacterium]|nr:carbamoyltransferase [Gemmatimonadota bacterium]MBT5962560.1 carbamoyltransferase [Gemmatimonadota bacterium]MBT7456460.1 carbamoyltransferase [Gemmatimonadota bacterium]MBT7594803.1 carbamoyltransferase [Gemmatimonadota bacterium]
MSRSLCMSVILGLHVGHDGTAALVVDGRIVAAIGEERLSRTKQHYGFPYLAIAEVLRQGSVAAEQVTSIAIGGGDVLTLNPWQVRHMYNRTERGAIDFSNTVPRLVGCRAAMGALGIGGRKALGLSDTRPARAGRALEQAIRDCGLDPQQVVHVDHHLAHAASAYGTSPFEEALSITVDGYGDGVNTAIWDCTPVGIERLAFGPAADDAAAYSPGDFYSYATCMLGYKRNRHEGKITGLAALADPADFYEKIQDLLAVDVERASFSSSVSAFRNTRERRPHVIFERMARWAFTGKLWDPLLVRELERRCAGATPAQIAAAVQQVVEDRIVELASYWATKTARRKICLAGGVFANVKINQRIAELPQVDEVYIHPNMGDGGLSLGAALLGAGTAGRIARQTIDDVFLGPEFSDDEIEAALVEAGVAYERDDDIESRIAAHLHQGGIVARFDGRMEYGPRALGNRTIIAPPTDPSINDWLNKRLNRTEFMPFAPAVLAEDAPHIFDNYSETQALKFMTITMDVKPEWIEKAPAVCHVDGTARPQLLDPVTTPSFYKVVRAYKELSGLPLLINTSYNMHEEPIVCTPQDAIRAFQMGHLDVLAIGPFWVPGQNPGR